MNKIIVAILPFVSTLALASEMKVLCEVKSTISGIKVEVPVDFSSIKRDSAGFKAYQLTGDIEDYFHILSVYKDADGFSLSGQSEGKEVDYVVMSSNGQIEFLDNSKKLYFKCISKSE